MMDLLEAIKQRRSIRKYTQQPVSLVLVKEVLAAAGMAPSAHNSQPWRFIVLTDVLVKRKLADAMTEAWVLDMIRDAKTVEADLRRERVERFAMAPALILGCVTTEGLRKFPDIERQKYERDLAVQSFGAAMENLLLTAHALGLAACWFCAPGFCKETVRKILRIPKTIEPEAFVILGYSDQKPITPPKKPLREYCFMNVWGKRFYDSSKSKE